LGKSNTKPQGILNLVLASREARVSAPSAPDSAPKTQWAALCAAQEM